MSDSLKTNYNNLPNLTPFNKNRVHKIIEINTNNSYLQIGNSGSVSYVYATKSSPDYYSLKEEHKSDVYIKVKHNTNNSSENHILYSGFSYTYTETIRANDRKPAIIANQFLNTESEPTVQLYNIDAQIIHEAVNGGYPDGECHVNEKSDVSYILKCNGSNINVPDNEVTFGNIKSLLGSNDSGKIDVYCSYSALKTDYMIHDNCESNIKMPTHVWNLIDGYDKTPHSYVLNDTQKINAYVRINCDSSLVNDYLSGNIKYINDNYKYIGFEYTHPGIDIDNSNKSWTVNNINSNYSHICETNLSFKDFYNIAECNTVDINGTNRRMFFEFSYSHPSWRNNASTLDFYVPIKGTSEPKTDESISISPNNSNTAKFIKRISGLPIHIVDNELYVKLSKSLFYCDEEPTNYVNGQYGGFAGEFLIQLNFNNIIQSKQFKIEFNGNLTPTGDNHYTILTGDVVPQSSLSGLQYISISNITPLDYTSNTNPDPNNIITAQVASHNTLKFTFDFDKLENNSKTLNDFSILLSCNGKHSDYANDYSHICLNDNTPPISTLKGRIYPYNIGDDDVNTTFSLVFNNDNSLIPYTTNDGKINFYPFDLSSQGLNPNNENHKMKVSDVLANNSYPTNYITIMPYLTMRFANGGGSGVVPDNPNTLEAPVLSSSSGSFNWNLIDSTWPVYGGTAINIEDIVNFLTFSFDRQARIQISSIKFGFGNYSVDISYNVYNNYQEAHAHAGELEETMSGINCEANHTYYLAIQEYINNIYLSARSRQDFIDDEYVPIIEVKYKYWNNSTWVDAGTLGVYEGVNNYGA